jgi:HK97 family phage major capsid protein
MNLRLAKLDQRKNALVAQSTAILDAADKEDREPNEDDKRVLDANTAELQQIAASIKREQDLAAYLSTPVGPAWKDVPDAAQPEPVRDAWEDDPNKGFSSPREYLTSVMKATINGHTEDRRLLFLGGKRNGFEATAGSDEAQTQADPYGGFLVPEGMSPGLLQIEMEGDPSAGRTTMVPMDAPVVRFNARVDKVHTSSVSGGFVVYRRAETQTQEASRTQFEQVTLNAHPLMGVAYATNELLTDSPTSFAAIVAQGFRSEFGSKIANEKIRGTGVGEMEGVLTSPALISVTKETGQAADTIVYENIKKMYARCWGRGRAVWIYNDDCLVQLMSLVQVVGVGGIPVWQPSATVGEPATLMGLPAFSSEHCSTLGDAGDIMLVNWAEYLEGTYQPMKSDESMHVRFLYNEGTFRFTMRTDGRCWWRTALTPKNSAVTLSPIVALAAR